MFSDRILRPSGWFRLDVWRNGHLVERVDEPNAITIGYLDTCAAGLGGHGNGSISQFGIGSSAAPAAFGNTGLTAQFLKPLDGVTLAGGNTGKVTFTFSLGSGESNGLSIGEFGLLTASGVLVARKARLAAPIIKDNTISLSGTWTISFA